MMTPCREIAAILLTDSVVSQSRWKRLEIRMHISMCRFCGRLARQIRQVGEELRRSINDDPGAAGIESRLLHRLTRD